MLHGAQLAIEEANARGGYGGKPFKLMLHNDYDNWQAKAVYGDDRSTDPSIWGAASDEAVKMVYDDQDWAIFGSISSESTHIVLRVALKAEIPIVNSASTDPTIPETYIPWYFTDLQDDRVQGFDAGAAYLYGTRVETGCVVAREQPLWTVRRDEVSRWFAAPGPSGGDRAEVYAGRYRFYEGIEDHPVVAGGRSRIVGGRDSGGKHSEADEGARNEAARIWLLSHNRAGNADGGR